MLQRRLALTLALVLAVVGAGLGTFYWYDVQLVARTARRVDGGWGWSPEQRLVRYVAFASSSLKNPRLRDLPPLVQFYYWWNPIHPGAGDVLRWGSDYRGACGSHVRVVVAMLRASGVPSRPLLHLDDAGNSVHTVVEARIGGRWVVADALYGIVFRRRDGTLASAADMQADHETFLAQVARVPGYDIHLYNFVPVTHVNWNKIPVVLPAIRKLLVAILGEARVREISRPAIWMWPKAIYSSVCLVLAAVLAAWRGRRRFPAPPATDGERRSGPLPAARFA